MNWFEKLFRASDVTHISENDTSDERARRLTTLSDEEQRAYKWLFEGYSEAWTTETLGIEKHDAKTLFAGIYRKLGVVNSREIIHYYAPRQLRRAYHVNRTRGRMGERRGFLHCWHTVQLRRHRRRA